MKIIYKNHDFFINNKKITQEQMDKIGYYIAEKEDYLNNLCEFYVMFKERSITNEQEAKERNKKNAELVLKDIKKLILDKSQSKYFLLV